MLANRARMAAGVGGGGTETQYAIRFNGSTSGINCGSDSSLGNLHDAAITVEACIYPTGNGENGTGHIASKRGNIGDNVGWFFTVNYTGELVGQAFCATTNGTGRTADYTISFDTWHHVAMTWDDASYNHPRVWLDGAEVSYDPGTTTNRSGAVVSDAAQDLIIGNIANNVRSFLGDIAWIRISDSIRYTTGFTPPAKDAPPAVDDNTVEQWNFNEGSGIIASAEVNGSNDGTITAGSWIAL